MNLLSVSLRSMRVRALSTALTVLSIAVGTALIAAIWLLMAQTEQRYKASAKGYGVVIGPKEGSPLALVLNTVFNLGISPGILPLSVYEELHGPLRRKFQILYAIPQARGDNYRGFPIVGTTSEMFTAFRRSKEEGNLRFAAGHGFDYGHEQFLGFAEHLAEHHTGEHGGHHHHEIPAAEKVAVIGAEVARALGLGLGAKIVPVHGVAEDALSHHHEEAELEVIGILERTHAPLDRSIFMPISTFLSLDKHEAIRPGQEAAASSVALSAIVIDTASPIMPNRLRYDFQTRPDAQAAVPLTEIADLLRVVGDASQVLRVISWLVLIVAAISVCVALYNTMNERRREIAIMRSLGARRHQILRIILQEALLVAFGGAVLGVALCHAGAYLLGDAVEARTGVPITWSDFSLRELWLIVGVGVLGGLAGVLPAVKGSMTQVADNLSPTS